jgi:hypothetical protein
MRDVRVREQQHRVEPRGLSRTDAASYIGVSASLFDAMVKDGRVGPARMIDGRKVWDVRDRRFGLA